MTLDDIDFAALYREHLRQSGRSPKSASEWDRRAGDLNRSSQASRYASDFIGRMSLDGARTLLDIGCGPGTLALPLAARLERVYGLDFSAGMLACLEENARAQGLDNVRGVQRAWEDDWSDVPVCDIVVASRSGLVADLADALDKMNRHGRLRAYMTQLVGGAFSEPEIAALLGRRPQRLPDYLYTVSLLHQRDIHPRLDYLETRNRLGGTRDFEAFAQRVAWAFGPIDAEQRAELQRWYQADPERARSGGAPMRWAFISWEIPQPHSH